MAGNLCKDCRWYQCEPAYSPFHYAKCTHEVPDLIAGNLTAPIEPQCCNLNRYTGPCGIDGRWWEKKD